MIRTIAVNVIAGLSKAPGVEVVGNSWISLMSYQSRGYAYIRP